MMRGLYIKEGSGWRQIEDVIDVRAHKGKFVDENGQEATGDMLAIIMKFSKSCAGQVAMRTLVQMDPRVIDFRLRRQERDYDMSVILMGDDVVESDGTQYVIVGRLLGHRPAGFLPIIH